MRPKALLLSVIILCAGFQVVAAKTDDTTSVWSDSDQTTLWAMEALVDKRKANEAFAKMDELIRRNPGNLSNYVIRARVNLLMDEDDAAFPDVDKVLAKEPRHFFALTTKGRALLQLNCPKEALVYSDKAFAIAPHNAYVIDDRIDVLQTLDRLSEAIALLEQRVRDNPRGGIKRGQLIKMYVIVKNYNKVVEHSTVQLKMLPHAHNRAFHLTIRGDAYLNLRQYPKAEQDYVEALKLAPETMQAQRGLIRVYRETGRNAEAAKLEKRLKALEGDFRPL